MFYPEFNYIILGEKSKTPLIDWKPFQEKKFPMEMFKDSHKGNWAIVCGKTSGVMVVDIDSDTALQQLNDAGFDLLSYNTPIVKTGKGYHIYFKYDPEFNITNKVGILKNVDIRTQGGYVLSPPSIHPDTGNPYVWLKNPKDFKAIDMPDDLRQLLTQEHSAATSDEPETNRLNLTEYLGKSEGERDSSLAKAAGYIYGHPYNMSYEAGLDLLMVINSSYNPPLPLDGPEGVTKIAQSIYNKDKKSREHPTFITPKGKVLLENIISYLSKTMNYIVTANTAGGNGDNTEIYIYDELQGVYTGDIISKLGVWLNDNVGTKAAMEQRYIDKIITGLKNAKPLTKREPFSDLQFKEKTRLNLQNGVLDLETMELLPNSPEYVFLGKFPVKYDPAAQCPVWEKFLDTTLPKKHILTLQEFIGYCLIPDTRFQKALLLYGSGANGKSIVVNTINNLFGEYYSSKEPLNRLQGNQFAAHNLIGKLVNTSSETVSYSGPELDLFKAIVSGDEITVEQKYAAAKSIRPTARLIFASNHMLKSGDDSDGNYRRWIIIPFTNVFKGDSADVFLQDKINKELSGILNWAIVGLKRLYKNGKFNYLDEETIQKLKLANDSVLRFISDNFTVTGDSSDRYTKRQLYTLYKEWSDVEGHKPVSGMTFEDRLDKIEGVCLRNHSGIKIYVGLKTNIEK